MTRRLAPFGIACALLSGCAASSSGTRTAGAAFAVDPSWPKPMPNNWILGQVSGIAVDGNDHIWLIQRPGSLTEDEKGAALNPPRATRPPILLSCLPLRPSAAACSPPARICRCATRASRLSEISRS